jgi:hypothetical protein
VTRTLWKLAKPLYTHNYNNNNNTYSMEHSPSGEANWFSASQEIPRNVSNPKVLYRNNNNNNAMNTEVYQIKTKKSNNNGLRKRSVVPTVVSVRP